MNACCKYESQPYIFDKADRENLAEGELDALLAEAGLVGGVGYKRINSQSAFV